jgi:hypothetical protein
MGHILEETFQCEKRHYIPHKRNIKTSLMNYFAGLIHDLKVNIQTRKFHFRQRTFRLPRFEKLFRAETEKTVIGHARGTAEPLNNHFQRKDGALSVQYMRHGNPSLG